MSLLAVSLVSCGKPKSPDTKTPDTIKVGYLPILADLPFFVAMEKGFFSKHGLIVEPVRFESSPDIGTAILNSSIGAAASISTTVALGIESRDPGKLRIFAVDAANKQDYLSSIVVLRAAGIDSVPQLRGKKIGSFPGPGAGTFGRMTLEKYGLLDGKDYTWVELAAPNQLTALSTRTVDALFTYEPIATQAVLQKEAKKLLPGAVESTVIDPWQAGVWVVSKRTAEEQPAVTDELVAAINDAIDYIRSNPAEARLTVVKYSGIDSNVAAASVIHPFTKLGEIDKTTLQRNADIMLEKRVISRRIMVDGMFLSPNPAKPRQ